MKVEMEVAIKVVVVWFWQVRSNIVGIFKHLGATVELNLVDGYVKRHFSFN